MRHTAGAARGLVVVVVFGEYPAAIVGAENDDGIDGEEGHSWRHVGCSVGRRRLKGTWMRWAVDM